ncbi:MAG: hypothetical protein JNL01_09230 [Bdellovibrionales bacterium]|nr:hypothetical protein [Bdellovibrionales bacterium]
MSVWNWLGLWFLFAVVGGALYIEFPSSGFTQVLVGLCVFALLFGLSKGVVVASRFPLLLLCLLLLKVAPILGGFFLFREWLRFAMSRSLSKEQMVSFGWVIIVLYALVVFFLKRWLSEKVVEGWRRQRSKRALSDELKTAEEKLLSGFETHMYDALIWGCFFLLQLRLMFV